MIFQRINFHDNKLPVFKENKDNGFVDRILTCFPELDVERKWGNFPNIQDGQVIGVVGRRCRNKWYVEVKVGEEWGKAEIGDWVVHPNDWVVVELAWKSADGRDKEWRIVANIDAVPVVAPKRLWQSRQRTRRLPALLSPPSD